MNRPILVALLLAAACPAQRNSAKLTFTDREVTVEYGVAPYAKHSLKDLPIGKEWPEGADEINMLMTKGLIRTGWGPAWRFGMNEASVLRTQLPLVCGETVVAPMYEVLRRRGEHPQAVRTLARGPRAPAPASAAGTALQKSDRPPRSGCPRAARPVRG